MSLVGSLQDLPFADIVQILCLSRRSGTLSVSRREEEAVLSFRDGLLWGLDLPGEESPLVLGIRREGLVPADILEQAQKECRRANDSLLQNLAAKAYLDPERVRAVVLSEIRAVLRRLLGWEEGEFHFEIDPDREAPGRERPEAAGGRGEVPRGNGTLLRIPEGLDPREILLEEMTARGTDSVQHFFLPTLPSLPRRPPVASTGRSNPGAESEPRNPRSRGVIVVDERSVYRELLSAGWNQEGFEVEAFASPEPGYQRFAALVGRGEAAALVTELVLPETGGSGYAGGLELLIRARQEFPGARVILMSEGVDPTVEEAARSLGARGILQKPVMLPADAKGLREAMMTLVRGGARLLRDAAADLIGEASEEDHTETIRVVDQLSLLGALLGELRRPGSELEIPLLVLRLASEYFERGILLAVDRQQARGLGGFAGNEEAESLTWRCRNLALPLAPGSRIQEVVTGKTSVRGALEHPDELRLLEQLGGGATSEAVLLPLMSRDQVVAVLYGDNGWSEAPVGDTRGLEIFLGEVGHALERSLTRRAAASGPRSSP